jgi:hypothetical protein
MIAAPPVFGHFIEVRRPQISSGEFYFTLKRSISRHRLRWLFLARARLAPYVRTTPSQSDCLLKFHSGWVLRQHQLETGSATTCACRNSNTYIQMMESAEKWRRQNATNGMNCSRRRRVLVDRKVACEPRYSRSRKIAADGGDACPCRKPNSAGK